MIKLQLGIYRTSKFRTTKLLQLTILVNVNEVGSTMIK